MQLINSIKLEICHSILIVVENLKEKRISKVRFNLPENKQAVTDNNTTNKTDTKMVKTESSSNENVNSSSNNNNNNTSSSTNYNTGTNTKSSSYKINTMSANNNNNSIKSEIFWFPLLKKSRKLKKREQLLLTNIYCRFLPRKIILII